MQYKKGDRVRHPAMADWGLGQVLEDNSNDRVRIFFVGAGEKTLSLNCIQPIKVTGRDADNMVLDNLKINKSSSGIKYQSLPLSIQFFSEQFPQGFYGERFIKEEREYKDKAYSLANNLLNNETFSALLKKEEYPELTKRALKVVNATNLIFPNEKMALKDGLQKPDAPQKFTKKLYELLFGSDEFKNRFEQFCRFLEDIDAAKWTTVSYFLFILQPEKYMFVKPTVTQHAADLCGFEINYKSQINWFTYNSVMKFSNYLKVELSELKPRDMIDVQSFMFCIAPGNY